MKYNLNINSESLNLHESLILMEPTHKLNVNQRIKLYMYFKTKLILNDIDLKVILFLKEEYTKSIKNSI